MTQREREVEEYLNKKKEKEGLFSALKFCFALIGAIVWVICAILVFVYRFQNPQLTETEIVMYSFSKFWWAYLCGIVSYFYLHNA